MKNKLRVWSGVMDSKQQKFSNSNFTRQRQHLLYVIDAKSELRKQKVGLIYKLKKLNFWEK
jgi:hypothetical protein